MSIFRELVKTYLLRTKPTPWAVKQAAAAPGRYYGDGGTIHQDTALDVEVAPDGSVVAVWYRCQMLPFLHVAVGSRRAAEMRAAYTEGIPTLTGVEVRDPQ